MSSDDHLGQPGRGVAWLARRTAVACVASVASPTTARSGARLERAVRGVDGPRDEWGEERATLDGLRGSSEAGVQREKCGKARRSGRAAYGWDRHPWPVIIV